MCSLNFANWLVPLQLPSNFANATFVSQWQEKFVQTLLLVTLNAGEIGIATSAALGNVYNSIELNQTVVDLKNQKQ